VGGLNRRLPDEALGTVLLSLQLALLTIITVSAG
jgi:hypothetical protein